MEPIDKLNIQDIASLIADNADVSKKDAESLLREFFNLIADTVSENEVVKIKNFGTFKLTYIQARESVNVTTGEKIVIAPHYKLVFIPATTLRELVNKPFSHFETVLVNDGVVLDGMDENNAEPEPDTDDDAQVENVIEIAEPEADNNAQTENVSEVVEQESDNEVQIENVVVVKEPINVVVESPIEEVVPETKEQPEAPAPRKAEKPKFTPAAKMKPPVVVVKKSQSVPAPAPAPAPDSIPTPAPAPVPAKKKDKNNSSVLAAIIVVVAIVAIAAFFLIVKGNRSGVKMHVSNRSEKVVSNVPAVSDDVTQSADTLAQTESIEQPSAPAAPVTQPVATPAPVKKVHLAMGQTLRLLALDEFGSREFWIYIYLKNKDRIDNPNKVPGGMELVLPNKSEYDINPDNPQSIDKAKRLGDEVLAKF